MASARILIVEDEILVAREIESHLQSMAYEVVGIAVTTNTVIQKITESMPDLVLMDINLQGSQDGIDMAAEISDRLKIPVIYITAYADDSTLERAKLTNPFGYVLKPFTQQDLRVAIELALFRQQALRNEPSITSGDTLPASGAGGLPPTKLRTILCYIQDNLTQELTLERLANEVSMTSDYFARLFKLSTGKSVHQYVIHQRVERAKHLLRQSDLTIAEIALECGFANPSHLALHFKRIVGVTPKQFRHF
ncbi:MULTISPECIES: response regulator transcription factor [Nostoc]|uniref:Response regulator transcription factor n=1 Tax=Nostoc paludosum FACHB-159 TaxID=2692908 RepID=A0ABR8KMC9_9NOSO|nr:MULTISPECIES: response regulator transcription factor [Nostoc]MBD2683401.1 response regulator transcription factor [Nostoc sp. FACHB-857]MBD2739719.1 response regulator transcription factor [Nostoc paludosum FACHB-159]